MLAGGIEKGEFVGGREDQPIVPVVGMGATIIYWSDRAACTVAAVEKNGKRVVVKEDKVTRTDKNGQSECQEYEYEVDPDGFRHVFTLRAGGVWVKEGMKRNDGTGLILGRRDHYRDFSF